MSECDGLNYILDIKYSSQSAIKSTTITLNYTQVHVKFYYVIHTYLHIYDFIQPVITHARAMHMFMIVNKCVD